MSEKFTQHFCVFEAKMTQYFSVFEVRMTLTGLAVGSLLRLFTVAVVPALPDAVRQEMTASFWYFSAVCMGPNPMRS